MGEVGRYPHGTFCWVELGTTDVGAAKRFYGELLGWEMEDMPIPGGTYTMCRIKGKDVAALFGQSEQERGAPPHWNNYVAVDDLDTATARARGLGATVVAEPFDVMESGRMSVLADPTGAVVSLWEAGRHAGAGLVNEPGCVTWNELSTRGPEAAKRFYGDLFGWGTEDAEPDGSYASWNLGDLLIGGLRRLDEEDQAVPAYWMPYFVVESADRATEKVTGAGGTVLVPPLAVDSGRFTVIGDPAGTVTALFEMGEGGPSRGVDGS